VSVTNKNRQLSLGGDSFVISSQDDQLETILKHISKLVGFNGNSLYIEEISRYLLFNGKMTFKTFRKIKSICEGESGY
jgi:hypothetical protein